MEFYMKMPRNKREFVLFLFIVSVISVNILAPVISGSSTGFDLSVWHYTDVLVVLPFIWLTVVAVVLVTYKPAGLLAKKITKGQGSFLGITTVSILCSVLMISFCMTIFGEWIGTRTFSVAPLANIYVNWPRNFGFALATELLIAQPIARALLLLIHKRIDKKAEALKTEKESSCAGSENDKACEKSAS